MGVKVISIKEMIDDAVDLKTASKDSVVFIAYSKDVGGKVELTFTKKDGSAIELGVFYTKEACESYIKQILEPIGLGISYETVQTTVDEYIANYLED